MFDFSAHTLTLTFFQKLIAELSNNNLQFISEKLVLKSGTLIELVLLINHILAT